MVFFGGKKRTKKKSRKKKLDSRWVGLRFSKCTGGSVDFVFGGPSALSMRVRPPTSSSRFQEVQRKQKALVREDHVSHHGMFKLLLCIGAVHALPLSMFKLLDGTIKVTSPIVPDSASDSNSPEVALLHRWVNDNTNAEAYYLRAYEICLSGASRAIHRDQVNDLSFFAYCATVLINRHRCSFPFP
jgi:hypothetical protein